MAKTTSKAGKTGAANSRAHSSGPARAAKGASKPSKPAATKKKSTSRKPSVQENPLARERSSVYYAAPAPRKAPVSPKVQKAQPRRSRKRRRRAVSPATFLLLLLILGGVALGVHCHKNYEAFAEMKQVVSQQTFCPGTAVDGIDVSQMTLEQALTYWDSNVEPQYRDSTVTLDDGTSITATDLGYQSDYRQTLSTAWSAGRSGSLEERYVRMTQGSGEAASYAVNRTLYDGALVEKYVASLAQQVDQEAQDAKLVSFNTQTYNFEFEAEVQGQSLNQTQLVQDIEAALEAGGGSVQRQIDLIEPEITQENVSANYGMISYAVTDASSSSSNRLDNIRLALSLIDGTALEPGESFSFIETVGERTTERGFKTAKAYSKSKVVEEVGGGICQVSTTLFNAAVKADLQIDERHSHSLTVSYVDLGKDAAVDWGNKDLRFTNNSSDRIYIGCYLTDDGKVRIGIFGKLIPDGITITLESEKTETIDYDTEYQMSFTLPTGQQSVVQKGKNGARATTYKVWWDANGNELRRVELCKSKYSATTEIIEYGV